MDDISVAICDDSALMRNLVSRAIEDVPGLKVVAKAMNGRFLTEKIPEAKPDVIVLDIEMPEMNGIEFLKYRKEHKIDIPVIILSSIAEKGAAVTIQCLELGAADFITKPNGSTSADISSVADRLIELIASYGGRYARLHGKHVAGDDYYSSLISDRTVKRKLEGAMGKDKAGEFLASSAAPKPAMPKFSFEPPTPKEPAVITPLRQDLRP